MEKERLEIIISGKVQGVGFRYFTQELSKGFDLSGYSVNMPDRTVKVEIEGVREALDGYMSKLWEGPGRVDDVTIISRPATGEFSGFVIRH